ncbi:hypothetical protein C0J52_09043 [Blattella germanica]|nr:hypothetical protein C0J52_09043 [Blattella germanica]
MRIMSSENKEDDDFPHEYEREKRSSNVGQGLYKVLELPKTASAAEIKRNYRKLALKHHPENNPGQVKQATKKMQKINHAYRVLKDPKLRVIYDRGGSTALKISEQVGVDLVYGLCKSPCWLKMLFAVFGVLTACYFCFCLCCCFWCCCGKCNCGQSAEDIQLAKETHESQSRATHPRDSVLSTTSSGTLRN